MCEFKVMINGNIVFGDAVYAKADGNKVIVRDILGESMEFENCKILEVDVKTARLVLFSSKEHRLEPYHSLNTRF